MIYITILTSPNHKKEEVPILQIDNATKLAPQRYIQYLPVNVIRWMLLHKFMEFDKSPVKRMEDKLQDIILRNNYKYGINDDKEKKNSDKLIGKTSAMV